MPRLFSMSPGFSRDGESASRIIEHRSDPEANFWVFHSNKRDKLMVAQTDVVFACSILFEMNPEIVSYGPAPAQSPDVELEMKDFRPDVVVRYADGRQELICCRREPGSSKKAMSKRLPVGVRLITGRDIVERRIELDNCLFLSASITAVLDYTSPAARFAILDRFGPGTQGTIRQILGIPGIDPALLRGAMAALIAEGTLVTDLTMLLTLDTVVANITGSGASTYKRPQRTSASGMAPEASNPPAGGNGKAEASEDATASFGTGTSRRTLIPPEYRFAQWPAPDEVSLPEKARKKYREKKAGIDAYRKGMSFEDIKHDYGMSENEIYRVVKRCVTPAGPGSIHGYFAVLPYYRIAEPRDGGAGCRSKSEEKGGDAEDKNPGGPWAWTRLLKSVVGLEAFLEDIVLDHPPSDAGKRLDVDECWKKMKDFLATKGVGAKDYPLTNADYGRDALRKHIETIRNRHAQRYIGIYYGETSAKRARQIGGTPARIICPVRPGSFLQLDYYRIDKATKIARRNPAGELFEETLPRWYVALLVDSLHWSVLSRHPTLEINPSAASAIETLDRYVHPEQYRLENDPHGDDRLFFEQFGLTGNCFCVLAVDNAKCNLTDNFIRAGIYTFGCAVNFGPTYNWVTRAVCERAIGDISRRVNDMNDGESAVELNTFILDLARACNQHNSDRTERLCQTSPSTAFRNALNDVSKGLVAAPLAREAVADSKYLDHYFDAAVRGNLKKGVMPHCNTLGRRYSNDELKGHPELIQPGGSNVTNLTGRIKRWDLRDAQGAVNNTPIGKLEPDRQRGIKISVSDWTFFNRVGGNLKTRERLDRVDSVPEREAADRRSRSATSKKPGKASAPALQEERQLRRETYHGRREVVENSAADDDGKSKEPAEPAKPVRAVELQEQQGRNIWEGGADRFGLNVIRGGRRFG